ncbi:AmmeMemoRadiSam system protein B, partial [bacterium]|nr:AmmeMemoRadiSam system protein B [bacterium]
MNSTSLATDRPDLNRPRVRAVEAFPIAENGQQRICLRDPQRIAEHALLLPQAAVFIVSLFDGTRTLEEIQQESTRQMQQILPMPQLEELVLKLDSELYLHSLTYDNAVQEIERAYHDAPNRAAFHAGQAYEGDPEKLNALLNQLQDQARKEAQSPAASNSLTALVSPHIDLHRGGLGFAHAYNEVTETPPADLYIVLGTGHQSREGLFIATQKSYDTPLGLMPTDEAFVDEFNQRAPYDVFIEERLHRDEHSVEFQAVWLRHVLKDHQAKMVPILTGSLHRYIRDGVSPREDQRVADTLDLLRNMIGAYQGSVCVIAGADMSHVGKRFGHPDGIPETELKRVEQEDKELLDAMIDCNAEAFYQNIAIKKDRNNV